MKTTVKRTVLSLLLASSTLAPLATGYAAEGDVPFKAALKAPRGVARLRALLSNWLGWAEHCKLKGGCPIMAAAFEFDDRPGPVREAVLKQHQRMQSEMARSVQMCIETGEFTPDDLLGEIFSRFCIGK